MVSDKKLFHVFPIEAYVKHLTLGRAIFGHNLNKLRRSLLTLHTKYQGSMPNGFRQEEFIMFSLYKPICKTCHPRGGAIFGPSDII